MVPKINVLIFFKSPFLKEKLFKNAPREPSHQSRRYATKLNLSAFTGGEPLPGPKAAPGPHAFCAPSFQQSCIRHWEYA